MGGLGDEATVLAPVEEGKAVAVAVAVGIAETITPSGPLSATADASQAMLPPPPVAVEATLSGRVIGDYVLGERIGSGWIGVIYTDHRSKL